MIRLLLVYTALDVDTQTDVIQPVDLGGFDVSLITVYTEYCCICKQQYDAHDNKEDGFSYFLVHDLTSCYRPHLRNGRSGGAFLSLYRMDMRHTC